MESLSIALAVAATPHVQHTVCRTLCNTQAQTQCAWPLSIQRGGIHDITVAWGEICNSDQSRLFACVSGCIFSVPFQNYWQIKK